MSKKAWYYTCVYTAIPFGMAAFAFGFFFLMTGGMDDNPITHNETLLAAGGVICLVIAGVLGMIAGELRNILEDEGQLERYFHGD
jgi:hypothetical protein